MQLRDYQQRAVDRLEESITQGLKPILVLPTGAGKTVVAAHLVANSSKPVLFLVHRRELVYQAVERLAAFGIESGVVMGTDPANPDAAVQVASVQTLARRKKLPEAGLIIIDECHHAIASSWMAVVERYPLAQVIGLTATPYRLDGKGLGVIFDKIVVGATTSELCDAGALVPPVVYTHPMVEDLGAVAVRGGDFAIGELGDAMSREKLLGDVVRHWLRLARGMPTIVFAVNVKHSRLLVKEFSEHGVVAEHVDGTMLPKDRNAILSRLASGKTEVVSNCMVLGEGWDLPRLSCAVLARPTQSRGLYLQQVGRVMRKAAGKDGALILDHAGNYRRHGSFLLDVEFHLTDDNKVVGAAPTKMCPECYQQVLVGVQECSDCGHRFDLRQSTLAGVPQVAKGELQKASPSESSSEDRAREHARYVDLISTASRKRYRIGWARHQFFEQFGKWPRWYADERRLFQCFRHEPSPKDGKCAVCRTVHSPQRSVYRKPVSRKIRLR